MISTANIKIRNLRQIINLIVFSIGTAIMISGCTTNNSFESSTEKWKIYKNQRYGFEFPYPSHWKERSPDNKDGVIFIAPKNNNDQNTQPAEIRAWASKELPALQNPANLKEIDHNFITNQGISGVLVVETKEQLSIIKLTITHKQVKYYWQGQSKNQDFKYYYPLFSYITKQYRIK